MISLNTLLFGRKGRMKYGFKAWKQKGVSFSLKGRVNMFQNPQDKWLTQMKTAVQEIPRRVLVSLGDRRCGIWGISKVLHIDIHMIHWLFAWHSIPVLVDLIVTYAYTPCVCVYICIYVYVYIYIYIYICTYNYIYIYIQYTICVFYRQR